MKNIKSKSRISIIALILVLSFSAILVALPATTAQNSGEKTSYAYIFAAPNPVGVNQRVYLSMLVDQPLPEASVDNDIRRIGYTLTITKPDEGTDLFEWAVINDTTGIAFMAYRPDQVGAYTLKFDYAGQVYTWNATAAQRAYTGVKYLPATKTITLFVQEDPIPGPTSSYPLPSEYWSRPIEGQNTVWWTISSHWLGGAYLGTHQVFSGLELYQKSGIGPEAPHVLWTKPIEFGGVVGGTTSIPGETHYSGGSYEGRFNNALIMHGRLYFGLPLGHSGSGGGYASLDLRTGEEIWYRGDLGGLTETSYWTPIAKGEIYTFETENQHGAGGGILWQVIGSTWNAIDPFSGKWMYNLTNVPSGTEVYADRGEIVRYVLNYEGRRLALWNFTEAPGTRGGTTGYRWNQWRPSGKTIDTSTAYSWNVSIPDLPGLSAPAIAAVLPGDTILGRSSAIDPPVGRYRATPDPYTVWAISDKPETRGDLLWIMNYTAPPGNLSRILGPVDPVNRVWTMTDAETFQWLGYSLDNGSLLWGPTNFELRDIQFFGGGEGSGQRGLTAYGNMYVQGYGGELFAFSTKDGTMLWKYNNTDSGLETPWGLRPIFIAAIADGKVYAFNNEHSPNTPLYKDNKIYCIDAFTGEEIYTMLGWAGQVGGRGLSTSVLAEGILVYYNYYDNQIYAIGKGPSDTTVTASPQVSVQGSSVLIQGTVVDIAAGTQQNEQAARFPSGVPAVSDESMSKWMEYVYMQKPRPADTVGVDVLLSIRDPNGNYHDMTVKTDASGTYSLMWEPPVPGKYTVYAIFQGTEGYWPSQAQTAFGVDQAPSPGGPIEPEPSVTPSPSPGESPSPSPTATASPSPSAGLRLPFPTEIAIAVAVVVAAGIGVVAYWFLRKR